MMNLPTFKDNQGREYSPALDFIKLREIRSRTTLDFGQIEQFPDSWAKVLVDDQIALAALWVSISDRAACKEDEWLAAMDGETLEAGCDALLEAVRNFTRPQRRGMLDKGAAQIHARYKEAIREAERTIQAVTNETTKEAIEQLGTQLRNVLESSDTLTSAGP